eukprot:TRINITY_DN1990_c0_g1_i4.p2 TRINITY_DN1990_c0_g1~~TRINITY_DN1990_c0_g1_i4.p2  ORF type:complete len:220 (+),score=-20.55 TRINITY_DN1990_c0_g1_i4:580-1239(+)
MYYNQNILVLESHENKLFARIYFQVLQFATLQPISIVLQIIQTTILILTKQLVYNRNVQNQCDFPNFNLYFKLIKRRKYLILYQYIVPASISTDIPTKYIGRMKTYKKSAKQLYTVKPLYLDSHQHGKKSLPRQWPLQQNTSNTSCLNIQNFRASRNSEVRPYKQSLPTNLLQTIVFSGKQERSMCDNQGFNQCKSLFTHQNITVVQGNILSIKANKFQ